MAILNSIRKRGFFLIIIIALALFAFVLDGVINSKTGGGGEIQNTVATINGKELTREGFMSKVEQYQRNLGPNANASQAINAVWDRELRGTLIQQQVDELGMTISQDQMDDRLSTVLANNPSFQDENGFFSEGKMIEYIASVKGNPTAKGQWDDFIVGVKESILQTNYMNMVKGGLVSTVAEGEQQYRFENDKVNMEYVHVPYTKIADADVEVSEAEIAAYVKANPAKFEIDPIVDVQYVTYSEEASQADIDNMKAKVAGLVDGLKGAEDYELFVNQNSKSNYVDQWMYKSNLPADIKDTLFAMEKGNVYGPYKSGSNFNISKVVASKQMPDTATARHILIPFGLNKTDSITRTKVQAKVTADSLLTILKRNKGKFESFVKQFSSDAGSVEKGGRYEDFPYRQMVPAFRDFCFENKVGSMGVVETQFGYHLIEVEKQKNNQEVVKIATISKEIEASEKTLSNVFSEAAKFEEAAQSGDFTALAEEKELKISPVNKIGRLDATIPGIGNNRSIVNWAFGEDAQVGDVKRFNVNDAYVIAQLTRKSGEKSLQSIAEASAIVTPILRNEKKAAKIRASVSGATLQEIASSQNVSVKTATAVTRSNPTIAGAGTEPAVVGAAFGTKVGEQTKMIDGVSGVFVVRVTAKNDAPEVPNYKAYTDQLNTSASGAINNSVYQALKKAADIEDNRGEFF